MSLVRILDTREEPVFMAGDVAWRVKSPVPGLVKRGFAVEGEVSQVGAGLNGSARLNHILLEETKGNLKLVGSPDVS